jgi:hypothetical protein
MATTEWYSATESSQELAAESFLCKYYILTMFCIRVFLTAIGCFGNAVTSWLLWSDRKKSATFFLLLCIVICDFLFLGVYNIISMVSNVFYNIDQASKEYAFVYTVHQLYLVVLHKTALASKVYLTIMVSLQRYVSTCYPLRAKDWGTLKVARGQLVGCVVFSFLVWSHTFFGYTIVVGSNGYPRLVPLLASNATYQLVITGIQFLFLYILPLLSLAILSLLLIRGLNVAHKRRAALKGEDSRKARLDHQISLMIAILMLMVMVNQAVVPVRGILGAFFDRTHIFCGSVFFYYDPCITTMQVITASMSFFLCLLTIKKYRKAFRGIGNQNAIAPTGSSTAETLT